MNTLAMAFANGKTEPLKHMLDKNCKYVSDYSSKHILGYGNIIEHMNSIFSNIKKEDMYSYQIVPFEELSNPEKWKTDDSKKICPFLIKLYQCDTERPVSIIYVKVLPNSTISDIVLSRDSNLFDVIFYKEEAYKESPLDIPSSVYETDNSEVYIWRQANKFFKDFLEKNEYTVEDIHIHDDCIGYRCKRRGINYTIYMYAYGKKKNITWDETYHDKLMDLEYSKDSKVLAVYLQVKRYRDKENYRYDVLSYNGSSSVEFWILDKIGEKKIFRFYPREEMSELVDLLICAYNNQDADLYDWIITKKDPKIESESRVYMNDGFFGRLKYLKQNYGNMKKGYVRFNDLVYCAVPYIEGYGFYSFTVNNQDKIDSIKSHIFDRTCKDFLRGENECKTIDIPKMENVYTLPSKNGERFVLVAAFSNGKLKRYQLPIEQRDNEKEVICYDKHVFSDGIWKSAKVIDGGHKICFSNDYTISYIRLYYEGTDFDSITGEFSINMKRDAFVVQACYVDSYGIGKILGGSYGDSLYLFDNTKQTAKRLPEEYQNTPIIVSPVCGGYSHNLIMVSLYGEMTLCYHHDKHGCAGMWGWIDKDFNVVIKPQYIFAENFQNGFATVSRGIWIPNENGRYDWKDEAWGVIDTSGKEVIPCKYDEIYTVNDSEHLYLTHKDGWEHGNYCIVDRYTGNEILQLEFDFDAGYIFNYLYETEDLKLVFVDHQPGEEKDLISIFDLTENKWLAKQEVYTQRTYNGKSRVVVEKEGEEIIIF